jgi:hypothetical protein
MGFPGPLEGSVSDHHFDGRSLLVLPLMDNSSAIRVD